MSLKVKRFPGYYAGQKYSKSVVAGNLVICAGMDGTALETGKVTSEDVATQTTVALSKVKDALTEAGTSMNNIVRTAVYLKNRQDYPQVREAEVNYYRQYAPSLIDQPPASKVVEYQSHVTPGTLVEFNVTAVLSPDKPNWEVKKYPLHYAGMQQTYSRVSIVGNLVFCSGLDARSFETGKVPSDDIANQVTASLDNLKISLRKAGTKLDNVVDTVMLLTDLKDYACMRETEAEYYQSHARRLVDQPPTSTFIQSNSLSPGCKFEIQATAVLSQDSDEWKVTKYPEWCEGKRLVIPWVPASWPHLSKAITVGDFIIGGGCSARVAKNPDTIGTTIGEQMKVTLSVIKDTLEDAGGSLENIIQTFIMLKDIRDYPQMRQAEIEYYQQYAPRLLDAPPVCTIIQPYSLARPDYLIEMNSLSVITE